MFTYLNKAKMPQFHVDGICVCLSFIGISVFIQYITSILAAYLWDFGRLRTAFHCLPDYAGIFSFFDGAIGRSVSGILYRLSI